MTIIHLVYYWPDKTWCDKDEYYQYANWMSDDFEIAYLTETQYEYLNETGDLP